VYGTHPQSWSRETGVWPGQTTRYGRPVKAIQDGCRDTDRVELLGLRCPTGPHPACGILSQDILVALPAADAKPLRNIPLVGVLEPNASISGCLTLFQHGPGDLGYVGEQHITFIHRMRHIRSTSSPPFSSSASVRDQTSSGRTRTLQRRPSKLTTATIPIVIGAANEL
jgi:hypothetical protein